MVKKITAEVNRRGFFMRNVADICAGLAILAIPCVASAQDTEPLTQAGSRSPDAQFGGKDELAVRGTATGTAAEEGVEEIVVTAQKRAENLQRVPIAITAVTEASLEAQHITSTGELAAVLPGLKVGNSAGSGLIYLRGIGQNSGAPGIVNPISTYLDGIYIGIARLGLFDLNAVSQVTLLRGPQGSLFGRNASGGIIQVVTKDPSFSTEGSAMLGYGNFNTLSGALYATTPLTETVAANISFKVRHQGDGQIKNLYTGNDIIRERTYSAQSKLLWKPSDDTIILLNGAWIHARDLRGIADGPSPGFIAGDGVTTFLGEDKVRIRYDPTSKVDTKLASMKIEQDLGWAEISNLAHGLWSKTNFLYLQQSGHAGRPNPNNAGDQTSTSFTNIAAYGDDLQISSPSGGPLQWIAGLSYEYERTRSSFGTSLDEALIANTISHYTSEAWAGFAQATLALAPSTRVTGGIRYTTDTLKFRGVNTVNGLTALAAGLPPKTTYNQVTWRAAIDHDLTDRVMIYAAANRGFKAGQYNIVSVTNPPVRPEIVDGYEVGFKSRLFDNRLRLNTAFFYQRASDLQLRAINGAAVILFNAAKAETYGANLDFEAALSERWSLRGGFEWLPSAKYTSFPGASAQLPTPLLTIPANCTGTPNARIGGTVNLVCDLTGRRMIFAAEVSANLAVRYAFDAFGGKMALDVADQYSSRYFVDPNGSTSVDPFHLVNASLSWTSSDDKWNLRLWGTNLSYAKTYINPGFIYIPGEPRKYGVEVGMKF
jgi:iron complex outermembrane receptor protein